MARAGDETTTAWPAEGLALDAARRRIVDRELWDALADAEAAMASTPADARREATLQQMRAGRVRYETLLAAAAVARQDGTPEADQEAALLEALAAVEQQFRERLRQYRADGRRASPAAERVEIPKDAWPHLQIIGDLQNSILTEPLGALWYDVRVYPPRLQKKRGGGRREQWDWPGLKDVLEEHRPFRTHAEFATFVRLNVKRTDKKPAKNPPHPSTVDDAIKRHNLTKHVMILKRSN